MTAPKRQRLFFALWPDPDIRRSLADVANGHLRTGDGRAVAPGNLHLTLVFLGAVDDRFRECAEQAAGTVRGAPFVLELARVGHWRRPRVLWSAPEHTPDALAGLAASLESALESCGHAPESRPFRAHVTLARKVRGPLPEATHPPVSWAVSEFHLVVSETLPEGARYRPLRSWSLG